MERQRVLSNILEAVRSVETCSCFTAVLPEVGTNITMALPKAKMLNDVAGLTGRIIKVEDTAVGVGEPKFGAARYMGNVLLTAMKYSSSVDAAINIRFTPKIIEVAQELGMEATTYIWDTKPIEVEESKCGIPYILDSLKRVPEVVYDLGGLGIEPVTAIFASTAVTVASKAIQIAQKVSKKEDL